MKRSPSGLAPLLQAVHEPRAAASRPPGGKNFASVTGSRTKGTRRILRKGR